MKTKIKKNLTGSLAFLLLGVFSLNLLLVSKAFAIPTLTDKAKEEHGSAVLLNVPIGDVTMNDYGMTCVQVNLSRGDMGYDLGEKCIKSSSSDPKYQPYCANNNCRMKPCEEDECEGWYRKGITYDPKVPNSLLSKYTKIIYRYVAGIIILLFVSVFTGGGLILEFSGGDKLLETAKEIMWNAIRGFILFLIIGLVLYTINPEIFGVF